MTSLEEHLTEKELAAVLHVNIDTIRSWRLRKTGPRYVKLGRLVRNPMSAIEALIAAGVREPQA